MGCTFTTEEKAAASKRMFFMFSKTNFGNRSMITVTNIVLYPNFRLIMNIQLQYPAIAKLDSKLTLSVFVFLFEAA